ncbi:hypothetical protein Nepgr_004634 [Nepenthes gracilis]|uniref:Uncharacterized protein n=1 Tax=Nepenthes gracilis TaxID=150966 RepID=A0AAD3S1N9_NEPGR|nr:hypothetical protein Nepgr_004634 [Nepenthes gracilis]
MGPIGDGLLLCGSYVLEELRQTLEYLGDSAAWRPDCGSSAETGSRSILEAHKVQPRYDFLGPLAPSSG